MPDTPMSSRPMFPLAALSLTLALGIVPAAAQTLQRPDPTPPAGTAPATSPAPGTVPAAPAQRARPAPAIPETGPAPAVAPAVPTPSRPPVRDDVRDFQGRPLPGAREVVPGRAVDPATGQDVRTRPATRPVR